MLTKINNRLESLLYNRGHVLPEVRQLIRNQLYITGAAIVAGLASCWITLWPMYFAAGAILVTVNFVSLSKFLQEVVFVRRNAVLGQLVRFYGRLILTGVVLFVLIVWLEASVSALLAGLSTVVLTIAVWGCTQLLGRNVKEA